MPSSPSAPPEGSAKRQESPHAWLTAQSYAHRGLHGPNACENSRSAFQAAIDARHGIELDVRLSRDGFAIVFHDAALGRLTGAPGLLADRTVAELALLKLGGTNDRIETLPAILALIASRAPLLIELKTDADSHACALLCLSVRHALEGYRGRAAIMSFDPHVPRWFARHAPQIPRGLVVGPSSEKWARRNPRYFLRRLLNLGRAKPHFLAHDIRALPSRLAARLRKRGIPVLAWTVRTAGDHARAAIHADQIIFERS